LQTDRIIPNATPKILISDNERETFVLINVANSGDGIVSKKEADKILGYKDLTIEIQCMWNVKTSDTSNNRGNWNHLKIIQKIPEQRTGKASNQGTAHML
jgi:hypothetical protein